MDKLASSGLSAINDIYNKAYQLYNAVAQSGTADPTVINQSKGIVGAAYKAYQAANSVGLDQGSATKYKNMLGMGSTAIQNATARTQREEPYTDVDVILRAAIGLESAVRDWDGSGVAGRGPVQIPEVNIEGRVPAAGERGVAETKGYPQSKENYSYDPMAGGFSPNASKSHSGELMKIANKILSKISK